MEHLSAIVFVIFFRIAVAYHILKLKFEFYGESAIECKLLSSKV